MYIIVITQTSNTFNTIWQYPGSIFRIVSRSSRILYFITPAFLFFVLRSFVCFIYSRHLSLVMLTKSSMASTPHIYVFFSTSCNLVYPSLLHFNLTRPPHFFPRDYWSRFIDENMKIGQNHRKNSNHVWQNFERTIISCLVFSISFSPYIICSIYAVILLLFIDLVTSILAHDQQQKSNHSFCVVAEFQTTTTKTKT